MFNTRKLESEYRLVILDKRLVVTIGFIGSFFAYGTSQAAEISRESRTTITKPMKGSVSSHELRRLKVEKARERFGCQFERELSVSTDFDEFAQRSYAE